MRSLPALLLALLLSVLCPPALAGPAESLADARAHHAAAAAELDRVEAEQAARDRTLQSLAAEIEGLKSVADRPLLPGVRDPRLDDRLKRSRAVAEELAALDRAAAEARSRVEQHRRALLDGLDAELTARRAALAVAPAMQRRALFDGLRSLIEERQALARRPAHHPARAPALPAPPSDAIASPDELRELADETRDHAEQVQGRLGMLARRLASLRERQRLVRAAAAFSRDDALFAQDERNRQLVRREDGIAVATATPAERPERATPPVAEAVDDSAADMPGNAPPNDPEADGDPQAGFADGDGDNAGGEGSESAGFAPEPGPDVVAVLPEEAVPAGVIDGAGGSDDALVFEEAFDPTRLEELDELSPDALARRIEAIEARRQRLEKTRAELEARGAELERRARALEAE